MKSKELNNIRFSEVQGLELEQKLAQLKSDLLSDAGLRKNNTMYLSNKYEIPVAEVAGLRLYLRDQYRSSEETQTKVDGIDGNSLTEIERVLLERGFSPSEMEPKLAWIKDKNTGSSVMYSIMAKNKSVSEPTELDYIALIKEAVGNIRQEDIDRTDEQVTSADNNLLILNVTDFHLNKRGVENNETLDGQMKMLIDAIVKCCSVSENISKILFIIGHDFFNSDYNACTTAGTPQDDIASQQEAFKVAYSGLIRIIDILNAIAQVDIVVVNGNHDTQTSKLLGAVLEVHCEQSSTTVQTSDDERMYYRFGNNAIMMTHHLTQKADDYPAIFAIDQPVMFSECKNRLLLTGHLHSKKTTSYVTNLEKYGMEWIQCPSLASTDRWHDTKGFIGNKRRMMSLVVNIEEGITDHKYYNVKQ